MHGHLGWRNSLRHVPPCACACISSAFVSHLRCSSSAHAEVCQVRTSRLLWVPCSITAGDIHRRERAAVASCTRLCSDSLFSCLTPRHARRHSLHFCTCAPHHASSRSGTGKPFIWSCCKQVQHCSTLAEAEKCGNCGQPAWHIHEALHISSHGHFLIMLGCRVLHLALRWLHRCG